MKFKPENGQQWQAFDREWCAECTKAPTCPIPGEAAERRVTSPHYPKEWIERNGTPVCTLFSSRRSLAG